MVSAWKMHSIGHVDVEGVRNERKITQGKSRNTKKKLWQQQKNRSPFFSRAKHKFLQKRNTTAHFSVHIHCAMGSSGETQPFHSNERQMHAWRKNILVKHKKGLLDTADPCSRTDRTMQTMTVCAIAFTSTGKTAFLSLSPSLSAGTRRWMGAGGIREKPKSITIFFWFNMRTMDGSYSYATIFFSFFVRSQRAVEHHKNIRSDAQNENERHSELSGFREREEKCVTMANWSR